MIQLNYNEQQIKALWGLLDVAVKSRGLEVAEAAVFFSKTIKQAQAEAQKSPPPVLVDSGDTNPLGIDTPSDV